MKIIVILLASVACLSSCGIIPDYQSPPLEISLPEAWTGSPQLSALEPLPWLELLADPQLTALIEEALQYNHNLHAAAARVASARAAARINGADRLPQLSAGVKGSRAQRNSTSGFSISNPRSNSFGVDFTLSWELDVWGRLQNQADAAGMEFSASERDYQAARLSLAANVAIAWLQSIEAGQQLALAEKKHTAYSLTQDIIFDGFVQGTSSALDLRLAKANQDAAVSQRDARKIDLDRARRSLEILLGRYPDAQLIVANGLPISESTMPVGLPGELLRRRPDLQAAEQRLMAADQRLTAAWKNMLPRFSFAASGGTNAGQLADILNYDTLVWNIIGNLTQPIFQGGRLIAEKDRADAETLEAAANYAQIVLQAFYEVETALVAEDLLRSQQQALKLAVEESVEAEQLALEEYSAGLTTMITLLEAQRRSYDAQSELLRISRQRLINRISLYLALGGNLSAEPPPPVLEKDSLFFSLFN